MILNGFEIVLFISLCAIGVALISTNLIEKNKLTIVTGLFLFSIGLLGVMFFQYSLKIDDSFNLDTPYVLDESQKDDNVFISETKTERYPDVNKVVFYWCGPEFDELSFHPSGTVECNRKNPNKQVIIIWGDSND